MRKVVVSGLVAVAAVLSLAGCGGQGETVGESGFTAEEIITIDYKGHPLNCIKWDQHYGDDHTCDFVEYYEKYGTAE